jgi:hypothetical protein
MLRVTKTELVWPGKHDENGVRTETPRVSLPFQVIERVNESRGTREATKRGVTMSLFDTYTGQEGDTFEDGWRNKLIWGDNLLVMGGKVDLIYIDPPFAATDVLRFASLGTTEQGASGTEFDYLKPSGAIGFYHPDWVAVQTTVLEGEIRWILETKGRVWPGTEAKDAAMRDWCERVTRQTKQTWRFARVNLVDFDKLKPKNLSDLVEKA